MAVLGLLFITVGHGVWCDFNQRSGGGQSKVGGGEAVGDEVGRCKQQPVLACRWRGCSADGATGKGRGAQGGEEKWGQRERETGEGIRFQWLVCHVEWWACLYGDTCLATKLEC
jgi:hypothetical protein